MPSNTLNTLLTSGLDAFSNLYKAVVTTPFSETTELASVELRIKDIKIPNLTLGEYKNSYKTVDITRLNAQFTGERELSFRVRIDSNWTLYNTLKKWRSQYYTIQNDKVNFGTFTANSPSYGSIKIYGFQQATASLTDGAIASGADNGPLWSFEQVLLYDIVEPQFQRATSAPVEVECKFMFGHMIANEVASPAV